MAAERKAAICPPGSGIVGRPEGHWGYVRKRGEREAVEFWNGVHREGGVAIVLVSEEVGAAGVVEDRAGLQIVLNVSPGDRIAGRFVVLNGVLIVRGVNEAQIFEAAGGLSACERAGSWARRSPPARR